MCGKTLPRAAFGPASPALAAGGPEMHAHRLAVVRVHRLAFHGEPCLAGRKPPSLPLPGLASVHRSIDGSLAARTDARPNLRAIHREDPDGLRIARMDHHRKADRA